MKSGPFIKTIADAYAVDEKTVAVYARALREAGLLTTGARGVNAPNMTPQDAARLTIAILSTDKPSQAVDRLRRFGPMVYSATRSKLPETTLLSIQEGYTFEQTLTTLFSDRLAWAGLAPYVEVRENARRAVIEIKGGEICFVDGHRTEDQITTDRKQLFGVRRSRGVAWIEVAKITVLLDQQTEDGN